jgi:5-methylthioadenosine/S-adenosylhomocysteine deaminase
MRHGAEALGLCDKVDTLTPGIRAGVVVVSSKRRPSHSFNQLGTTVLQSSSADVDLVMVEDETLKPDQQLVGMDVD